VDWNIKHTSFPAVVRDRGQQRRRRHLPPGDGRSRREERRRGRLKKGERNARVSLRMRVRGTFAAFCSTGCGYRWSRNSNNPFLICAQGRVCGTCWRKSHLAPRLITGTAYTAGWSIRKSIVKCCVGWNWW
jgi:hypothetical protein